MKYRCLYVVSVLVLCLGAAVSLRADTFAYAAGQIGTTRSSAFGILDLNTGAFNQIATENVFFPDLAIAPNGTLYAITEPFGAGPAEFATINPSTGAITNIAVETVGLNTMAFSSNGTLYADNYATSGPFSLYVINPANGAVSFITNLSGALSNSANQIRFLGSTAYTTSYTTPSNLYTIDLSTGTGTLIGSTGLNANNGLGAVVNGQFIDIASTGSGEQIFSINPVTGAATPGASVNTFYVFAAIPVPEPASVTLFACAGALLAGLTMRRRRAISSRLSSEHRIK